MNLIISTANLNVIDRRCSDMRARSSQARKLVDEISKFKHQLTTVKTAIDQRYYNEREVLVENPEVRALCSVIRASLPRKVPNLIFRPQKVDGDRLKHLNFSGGSSKYPNCEEGKKREVHDRRQTCNNVSFQFGDMSCLNYVAPNGSDDSFEIFELSPGLPTRHSGTENPLISNLSTEYLPGVACD